MVQQTVPSSAKEFFVKSSSLSLPEARFGGLRCGTITECHTICVKITTTHPLHVSVSCMCVEGELEGPPREPALLLKKASVWGKPKHFEAPDLTLLFFFF